MYDSQQQTLGERVAPEISDPGYSPIEHPNFFERFALTLIADRRDLPFIKLILLLSCTVIPSAFFLYVLDFAWWVGLAYVAVVIGYFLGPFLLMLHNTSHRPLFKPRYRAFRHLIPWVIGPFFGQSPGTYFAHHIGMHHPENNLSPDLSTTLHSQRDSGLDFLKYLFDFYVVGFPRLLGYLREKKRDKLFYKALIGELSFYALVIALSFINWHATLVVFVLPFLLARFGMMSGNWAQHAFIDSNNPEDPYLNSITCINTLYNRRCFNDGYHIGHHLKANRHWTEMPADFLKNQAVYAQKKAVVFQGIDYMAVWLFLMLKRYDWLANRFVHLGEEPLSQEEVIILLQERTLKVPRPAETAFAITSAVDSGR